MASQLLDPICPGCLERLVECLVPSPCSSELLMRRGRYAGRSPVLFGGSNPPEVTTSFTQGEVGKCWPAPTNLEVEAAETPEPFPPAFFAPVAICILL